MRLKQLLTKKKSEIVGQWFDALVNTYPPDTARFLKSQPDSLANPVGSTARQTLDGLYDELTGDADPANLSRILDPLIRIRAVQLLFTPAKALGFILEIKSIVRNQLGNRADDPALVSSLTRFDKKVDRALLVAFDGFQGCREHIYHLKATEEQSKIYKAFARAGLVAENPDNPDASDGSGGT
ncbi:MAG: RsbRD N-terminal domain-containing protein [Desulfobacterales bacterium]